MENTMTQQDFERLMVKVVNQEPASFLFALPAVWEAVSTDPDYVKWVQDEWNREQKELDE